MFGCSCGNFASLAETPLPPIRLLILPPTGATSVLRHGFDSRRPRVFDFVIRILGFPFAPFLRALMQHWSRFYFVSARLFMVFEKSRV